MFTWICPQCGREVPPSYTECPDCAEKNKPAAATPAAPPPVTATGAFGTQMPAAHSDPAPPPPPQLQTVFPSPHPGPPPPPPPPMVVHHRGGGMPAWLMTIVFALAFVGLGAGVYWGVNYFRGGAGPTPVTVDTPPAKAGAKPHPLQKYLEVAGMRFVGDKKQTLAKFVVINHSGAEISGLAATMTVWGRTQRSEEDAVGTISFKGIDVAPNEYKEVTAPLTTKLKIYELPDWQNVTTDIQITAPAAQ